MAGDYLREARKNYAEEYLENGMEDRAKEIALAEDLYTPMLKTLTLHPESEPDVNKINLAFRDVVNDISALLFEMGLSALDYENLVKESALRVKEVRKKIAIEEERLKDLNMLCGKGSEFQTVKTLNINDFVTDVSISEDNIISATVVNRQEVKCEIIDVQGNGLEGNRFVLEDGAFLEKTVNTSERKNMVDASITSAYEYSRINASSTEKAVFSDLNFDGVEAECIITLKASTPISSLKIETGLNTVTLVEVMVSNDNIAYTTAQNKEIAINDRDYTYLDGEYIYGSGIVTFPLSTYIKVVLRSNGYTKDTIAFEYVKPIDSKS